MGNPQLYRVAAQRIGMARPLQAAFRRNQGHIVCFMATPARQPAQVGDVCS